MARQKTATADSAREKAEPRQQSLSSFIWSVADLLRGDYKQSEYGKVILAVHRPAPPRLRAGSHQARRARRDRGSAASRAGLNPEPFLLREGRPALLQHLAARPEEADGRPGPHRREPPRLHAGVLARGARHLRALRLPHADRPARQGRAALPGHREVRQHRPAPRGRQQRPDGRSCSRS